MTRCVLLALFSVAQPCVGEVTFDWAHIGNAGNAADTRFNTGGHGSVEYAYSLSKHEVTNAQYLEFLNTVATPGDPYGLYNLQMAGNYGGISRSGSGTVSDPYRYSTKGGDSNWLARPVVYVSFFDALRFANWLHNGQGTGETESGAYTIGGATRALRTADAKYWIPSDDEWYKAAYYDASRDTYFSYPTSSNTTPGYVNNRGNLNGTTTPFADGVTDPGNYATHDAAGRSRGIGGPYHTTEVGEWENSASPYGTFDQGGNVWEWTEAFFPSSNRGVRGGAFSSVGNQDGLFANNQLFRGSTAEVYNVGFRIATVPEPTTAALATLAVTVFAASRRR